MREEAEKGLVILKVLTNNGLRLGIAEGDDTPTGDILYYNENLTMNEMSDLCIKKCKQHNIQMFDSDVDWVVE